MEGGGGKVENGSEGKGEGGREVEKERERDTRNIINQCKRLTAKAINMYKDINAKNQD